MRLGLLAVSVTCAALGCGNAPGDVKGGEPLFGALPDCRPQSADCGKWSHIYACYFASDTAIEHGCQAGTCHGTSSAAGTAASGFLCGSTADMCLQGLTTGASPLVLTSFKSARTLFDAFFKGGMIGPTNNNMPATGPTPAAPYTSPGVWSGLTADHEACINKWVSAGAPNN
jgi:hypothetical protein